MTGYTIIPAASDEIRAVKFAFYRGTNIDAATWVDVGFESQEPVIAWAISKDEDEEFPRAEPITPSGNYNGAGVLYVVCGSYPHEKVTWPHEGEIPMKEAKERWIELERKERQRLKAFRHATPKLGAAL